MGLTLFKPYGSISRSILVDGANNFNTFITISSVGGGSILLGAAPVTGVSIQQLTDFSVTKSLDKDFLVATFGDTPVKITLSGISFFNLNGCRLNGSRKSNKQIMDFYRENKLSNRRSKRVDVSIASGAGETPVVFRCVIVALDTQNQADETGISNMLYSYTMTLIGVDKRPE